MIQRVVGDAGLEWFAEIGLIVFVIAFILVIVRVLLMDRDEAEERANLPFEQEDPEEPPA